MAGGLPGLGSGMIRGPYAGWQLGQALGLTAMCRVAPGLARHGAQAGEVAKAVEPTVSAAMYSFSDIRRLHALSAARASAGLEWGGDRSAGPAGGRAACGERGEPP